MHFRPITLGCSRKNIIFVDVQNWHPWPNPRKQLITKHNKKLNTMKKTYTTPAIDLLEMEVESGIAASQKLTFDEIWLEEENGGDPIW